MIFPAAPLLFSPSRTQVLAEKGRHGKHIAFVRRLRERDAELSRDRTHSAATADMMDASKTDAPRFADKVGSALNGAQKMTIAVVGYTWMGFFHALFLKPPWIAKRANLLCTCLWSMLLLCTAKGVVVQRDFHLTIDGGSENWNIIFFAFCCLLVSAGVFRRIFLHRLPVGHTHSCQDAVFSVLSRYFFGRGKRSTGHNGRSPSEWARAAFAAFSVSPPEVHWVGELWDITAWLTPCINSIGGYGPTREFVETSPGVYKRDVNAQSHLHYAEVRFGSCRRCCPSSNARPDLHTRRPDARSYPVRAGRVHCRGGGDVPQSGGPRHRADRLLCR